MEDLINFSKKNKIEKILQGIIEFIEAYREFKFIQLTEFMDTLKEISEMIKSNGLDAVILDEAVAKNYVKNNKTLEMVNDEALLVEENLIIANKNSKDLIKEVNKAVDEFVKSKKYTELKSKWGC